MHLNLQLSRCFNSQYALRVICSGASSLAVNTDHRQGTDFEAQFQFRVPPLVNYFCTKLDLDLKHKVQAPLLSTGLPKGLREDFKYYFADFVRKGGPPPPLRTKFSPKKRLRIWGAGVKKCP